MRTDGRTDRHTTTAYTALALRRAVKPHVQISATFLYVLSVAWLDPPLTAVQYVEYFRFCG